MENGQAKGRNIKLGFFILLGLAFFLFIIFYIGSQQNLFTNTFQISAVFSNVSGLQNGNAVRFSGIEVGTVNEIEIIDVDKVRVDMTIESDVQDFIKKDSEVSIGSEGLVGNKVITISAGTPASPSVASGDVLKSVQPIEYTDILNNLNKSTKDAEKISGEIAEILRKVNEGQGTLGQLINNESIYNNLDLTVQSFANSSKNFDRILVKTSGTIDQVSTEIDLFTRQLSLITANIAEITRKINSSESVVGTLLTDTVFANNLKDVIRFANQTTQNLERGSFSLYQNMEALKHNFLFKGYFEDIGYWDKAEFEKTMDSREARILEKEKILDEREKQLDDLRKRIQQLEDQLKIKEKKLEETEQNGQGDNTK